MVRGCRKATREPLDPVRTLGEIGSIPFASACSRIISRSATRTHMWWMPAPRFLMKRAMGESLPQGARSSTLPEPSPKKAAWTPSDSMVSSPEGGLPNRVIQRCMAGSSELTAIPMWSIMNGSRDVSFLSISWESRSRGWSKCDVFPGNVSGEQAGANEFLGESEERCIGRL